LTPFHWPSLSELDDELFPFPFTSGEKEHVDEEPDIDSHPAMYTGPPPMLVQPTPPKVPSASLLAAKIVKSANKLFFISHEIPSSEQREWRLVRVHLEDSMALRPTCLTDGRYLVEFYILHSADDR
jgi:hypothetical protein